MAVDSTTFRHALSHFASGVTIVTMADDGELSGLTVSAFSSLSLNPPYILVCIDKSSTTLGMIAKSKSFGVNMLSEDQSNLSNHFASRSLDKFTGIQYSLGPNGNPLIHDAMVQMECTLVQQVDGGDHFILIGEVVHAEVNGGDPLLYFKGNYGEFSKK